MANKSKKIIETPQIILPRTGAPSSPNTVALEDIKKTVEKANADNRKLLSTLADHFNALQLAVQELQDKYNYMLDANKSLAVAASLGFVLSISGKKDISEVVVDDELTKSIIKNTELFDSISKDIDNALQDMIKETKEDGEDTK